MQMKPSVMRVLAAGMVLAIAMGVLAGAILAVPEENEVLAWTKVTFRTRGSRELSLFNDGGELLKCLQTDPQGICTTELLQEGNYYGVCRDGLVWFTLSDRGLEEAQGAAVVTDKYTLSFTESEQPGLLRITGKARQEWYEYELQSAQYSCKKILRCVTGEPLFCTIENLPYGNYTLTENGRVLCRVELTEEEPTVELSLP